MDDLGAMLDPGDDDGAPLIVSLDLGVPEGYELVALADLPLDGSWEVLAEGVGGRPPSGVRYTPKHHLATCAAAGATLVMARPIDLTRLSVELTAWAETLGQFPAGTPEAMASGAVGAALLQVDAILRTLLEG